LLRRLPFRGAELHAGELNLEEQDAGVSNSKNTKEMDENYCKDLSNESNGLRNTPGLDIFGWCWCCVGCKFQDTKNLQPKMIQPRRGMLLDRSCHRSDGNELSRRELERQIQELRRDKVAVLVGGMGGVWMFVGEVGMKQWGKSMKSSLGKI